MLGFNPLSTTPVSTREVKGGTVRVGQSAFSAVAAAVSRGSVRIYGPAAAFNGRATALSNGRRLLNAASPYNVTVIFASTVGIRISGRSIMAASAVAASTPHKRAAGVAGFVASAFVASTSHKRAAGYSPFQSKVTAYSNGKFVGFGSSFVAVGASVISDGRRIVFSGSVFDAAAFTMSSPTTAFLDMLTDARVRRRYVVEIHPEFARERLAS